MKIVQNDRNLDATNEELLVKDALIKCQSDIVILQEISVGGWIAKLSKLF